jgi:hypothetical protein
VNKTLIVGEKIYVETDDGLWRLMTITPTSGGVWVSFAEPQTLTEIMGDEVGDFVELFIEGLSDTAAHACVQGDDEIEIEDLGEADVKGAALLKRLDEGS